MSQQPEEWRAADLCDLSAITTLCTRLASVAPAGQLRCSRWASFVAMCIHECALPTVGMLRKAAVQPRIIHTLICIRSGVGRRSNAANTFTCWNCVTAYDKICMKFYQLVCVRTADMNFPATNVREWKQQQTYKRPKLRSDVAFLHEGSWHEVTWSVLLQPYSCLTVRESRLNINTEQTEHLIQEKNIHKCQVEQMM